MATPLCTRLAALALAAAVLPLAAQQPAPPLPQEVPRHGSSDPRRPKGPPLAMGAAFAPDGTLWMVAIDPQRRLFVQTSADEGRRWSAPHVLDRGDDLIAADGENRPKIAFGPNRQVVISYTEPLPKPYTGQIRMLRSEDGGAHFSPPFTVHADRQVITHRFESVAFDARGTLHTVWIDKRDLEAKLAAAAASAPADPGRAGRRARPKVDYRGAAIYRNESRDGGRSFGPDIKLADHSCECCRIALAPAPDGGLVALWRHVFAPNLRDHAFAPLGAAAPVEPVRASFDGWALDACPHHGPGLAAASDGGYHAIWFGERAGEARVRYGRLGADGAPQGEVREVPDEAAEHAAIAAAGRRVAIAWRSFDGRATRWRAWLSADGGERFELRELGETTTDNDHPLLLVRGDRIVALWRTAEGVRVERLAF